MKSLPLHHQIVDISGFSRYDNTTGGCWGFYRTNGEHDLVTKALIRQIRYAQYTEDTPGNEKLIHITDIVTRPRGCGYGTAMLAAIINAAKNSEEHIRNAYLDAVNPRVVQMVEELVAHGIIAQAYYRNVLGEQARILEPEVFINATDLVSPSEAYDFIAELRDTYSPDQPSQRLGGVACMMFF